MFKNYLKIFIRNLRRHRGYSLINISGLAIGLTCCILIMLWIQDELSFDRFNTNLNQLYRVVEEQHYSDGTLRPVAQTPMPLGPALVEDYPEILQFARFQVSLRTLIKYKNNSFYENGFAFADPSLLEMFTFPLIKGNIKNALSDPHSVLISERMAEKYFGDEDPIGQTLTMNNKIDFTVTGIFKKIPHNSHLRFDFLCKFEGMVKELRLDTGWWSNDYYTYLLLQKGASYQEVSEKIHEYIKKINPKADSIKFFLQPVQDIHLHSNFTIDLVGQSENRAKYVYIFSIIAIFVVLIACINFMNLSTARSSSRSLEIGLRKVVGAKRSNLISQFLGESILFSITAFLVALVLVLLLLPAFNALSGKELGLNVFNNISFLGGLIGLAFLTGIISGSYPALFLSSFQPAKVLKGSLKLGTKSSSLRKVLVIIQFSLSIILIIGAFTIYRQLNFILKRNLGYEKDHLIYLAEQGDFWNRYAPFKNELLQNSNILSVTASSDIPTYTIHSTTAVTWEGKNPEDMILFTRFTVDYDYFETFKMELLQGRPFSREYPTDKTDAYILNETGVKMTGIDSPVGKMFSLWGIKGKIIGIVKDYHFKSLHSKIEPMVLRMTGNNSFVFIRIKSENITETLKNVENSYRKFNQGYPFEFSFLDEALSNLYQSEKRTSSIFRYFMFLAIFISCLGLLGLASYMAEQRTKEIGIRKVLGASTQGIIVLLLKDFTKWVLLANLIAWPIAWYAMQNWLQGFSYRTHISPTSFLLATILSLISALLTVGYQAFKASSIQPVNALKYE